MSIDSAEQNEPVLAERRGTILLLTLNRPDRLNAWNDELEQRYFDLLAEADEDPAVRAVVVTGSGRGFCAGADMRTWTTFHRSRTSQLRNVNVHDRSRCGHANRYSPRSTGRQPDSAWSRRCTATFVSAPPRRNSRRRSSVVV